MRESASPPRSSPSRAMVREELRAARREAAVKMYELGRLSSGAAARLAGLPRVAFLARLASFGVVVMAQTEAELAEDLARA
jgi:predicted HTH domain antitoxin